MLTKEQKKNYISEITTQFENSKAVMVTHYQGLTMTQLDDLRAQMREHGIIFKITKNRITNQQPELFHQRCTLYQILAEPHHLS